MPFGFCGLIYLTKTFNERCEIRSNLWPRVIRFSFPILKHCWRESYGFNKEIRILWTWCFCSKLLDPVDELKSRTEIQQRDFVQSITSNKCLANIPWLESEGVGIKAELKRPFLLTPNSSSFNMMIETASFNSQKAVAINSTQPEHWNKILHFLLLSCFPYHSTGLWPIWKEIFV